MLAAVCAWWVMLAFGRTARMAEIIGVDEAEIRALGARDLVNAVALLLPGDARPAIAARSVFDLSDAARHGRGNARVLALTAGFAAFAALGLLGRR
jgi:hypothetical protein